MVINKRAGNGCLDILKASSILFLDLCMSRWFVILQWLWQFSSLVEVSVRLNSLSSCFSRKCFIPCSCSMFIQPKKGRNMIVKITVKSGRLSRSDGAGGQEKWWVCLKCWVHLGLFPKLQRWELDAFHIVHCHRLTQIFRNYQFVHLFLLPPCKTVLSLFPFLRRFGFVQKMCSDV